MQSGAPSKSPSTRPPLRSKIQTWSAVTAFSALQPIPPGFGAGKVAVEPPPRSLPLAHVSQRGLGGRMLCSNCPNPRSPVSSISDSP